ncbi:rhodanese-like domain-containing protein [Desulforhopalus singaporensis]|uniref:Rhodanese-like domain-containing protein n=1 Tax=Desulforhopalus singaporensis TaxID=91360 RepID=A0A1H0NDN8_9BACT|nr:rhodanese-like domain-containing protein [Desulforhopalus singaporensis]SDO90859.1 Rhodanese-like domain-containing protein [Desulforhopalus singaporensis]
MKRQILRWGVSGFLAASLLLSTNMFLPMEGSHFVVGEAKAETGKEAQATKGKITNISQKAKTIAIAQKDNDFFLLKFTDDTVLKNVESAKDFKVGEAILVHYRSNEKGENIAVSLEKALVKLPEGTREIKTDELADLVARDQNVVIVDARPEAKYAVSHIPGAISIPFAKVKKSGDDGAKLFTQYMDKQLVFYCGGPT